MNDNNPLHGLKMASGAEFSPCRNYRYALWRKWDNVGHVMFIGLNPSTADESVNDPTIRRCIGFAKAWGYGGIYMLNLFAFRSTDPMGLKTTSDPIGPGNDEALTYYRSRCSLIVAAWGAHKSVGDRGRQVCELMGRRMDCLGVTRSGAPKHPLYLPANQKLGLFWSPKPCPYCDGFGQVHPCSYQARNTDDDTCHACNGTGKAPDSIPPCSPPCDCCNA